MNNTGVEPIQDNLAPILPRTDPTNPLSNKLRSHLKKSTQSNICQKMRKIGKYHENEEIIPFFRKFFYPNRSLVYLFVCFSSLIYGGLNYNFPEEEKSKHLAQPPPKPPRAATQRWGSGPSIQRTSSGNTCDQGSQPPKAVVTRSAAAAASLQAKAGGKPWPRVKSIAKSLEPLLHFK